MTSLALKNKYLWFIATKKKRTVIKSTRITYIDTYIHAAMVPQQSTTVDNGCHNRAQANGNQAIFFARCSADIIMNE